MVKVVRANSWVPVEESWATESLIDRLEVAAAAESALTDEGEEALAGQPKTPLTMAALQANDKNHPSSETFHEAFVKAHVALQRSLTQANEFYERALEHDRLTALASASSKDQQEKCAVVQQRRRELEREHSDVRRRLKHAFWRSFPLGHQEPEKLSNAGLPSRPKLSAQRAKSTSSHLASIFPLHLPGHSDNVHALSPPTPSSAASSRPASRSHSRAVSRRNSINAFAAKDEFKAFRYEDMKAVGPAHGLLPGRETEEWRKMVEKVEAQFKEVVRA
ncbi:hypothetical protein YB2330_000742 [Saitoella coloradoensis]